MATRTGKIARLPDALRKEINQRLLDGQRAPQILEWLNAQPDAIRIWEADFEGRPASDENLSQWRKGGYDEWRRRNERAEHLKTLADYSVKIAKSGGDIADGAASIIAGNILEVLEATAGLADLEPDDDEVAEPKSPMGHLIEAAEAVAFLRSGNIARERLALDKKKVRQKDRSLALDQAKYETQTVSKFLEWARSPEAAAILDSGKPRDVVMADLRHLLFGTQPQPQPSAAS